MNLRTNFKDIATQRADRAVQKTDDDAAGSKQSAILRGYYKDDLLPLLYARPPTFRLPLINIGTYCRVQGINREIEKFLDATKDAPSRAIVSLGAGSDTRAFHLLKQHPENLEYYELDFPVKTEAKQRAIASHAVLSDVQNSGKYHLIPVDLRHIDTINELSKIGNKDEPVLVISECCLCYLPLAASDRVLQFFGERASKLAIAIYEPMSLNDEFGRVMATNMATRGLALPTLQHYSTLEQQKMRLLENAKLESAEAVDINTIYSDWLPKEDRLRISKLEFLDEVEEMHLLLRHYCVAWGSKGI